MHATTKWLLGGMLFGGLGLGVVVAQETENHRLRALPAPGEVTVDGALADWDLSGEILLCADVSAELEQYGVRAAAMYDEGYLYLSFQFTDRSPMFNQINPLSDPGGGWRGDSVELRALFDDDRSLHFQTWYYTAEQQPVMQMFHGHGNIGGRAVPAKLRLADAGETPFSRELGLIHDLLAHGARIAFAESANGRGYVQELALPWKLLTRDGRALAAGDTFRLGLQVNWGDESGGLLTGMPERRVVDLFNPEQPNRTTFFVNNTQAWGVTELLEQGNVAPSPSMRLLDGAAQWQQKLYQTAGPVEIKYDLPADGYATLVIEKPDGTRVRNLISDHPRHKGANTDRWDGTDDEGRLVSPGAYRVRGLFHQGLDVLYQFHFGNPSETPWATVDGRGAWLSNHANHIAVLADNNRIYVSAPQAEGPYPLIALDYDGNKVWGALARWHAGPMTRCGDYLYTVNDVHCLPAGTAADLKEDSEIELIRLDPKTGREALFPDNKSRRVISRWNLQERGAAKKWDGWTVEHSAHTADWLGYNPQGLAALDGTLYVALRFDDKLLKVDAETGAVVGEIKLPRPSGLAGDGQRLLAVSETQVVQVQADGTITPVVTENLKAPVALALDSKGNMYVSDWADQMCVKVFSADGTYIKQIGKTGGRSWQGPYDPSGMLVPSGLSVDAKDRLWVVENDFSPRRVSCWDTNTGKLILERIGCGRYGGMGYYVLPDRPEQGILMNNLVDLDWESGRWRVASTLWRGTKADEFLGFDPYTRFGRVVHRHGRRLLVHTSFYPQRGITIVSELTDEGLARPLAAVGPVWTAMGRPTQRFQGGMNPPPLLADQLWSAPEINAAARKIIPWFFEGPRAGSYWAAWLMRPQITAEARKAGWKSAANIIPYPNNNLVWCDLDGDGAVGENEIRFHTTPTLGENSPSAWTPEQWSGGVADENLTLYLTAIQDGQAYHFRLPVSRWTDKGAPVYEPEQAELMAESPYMGEAAWLSAEGNLLTLANIPGQGRPRRQRDPLVMFRPDGSIAWTFPSPWTGVHGSHTAPKEKRGQLVGPLGVFGEASLKGVGEIFAFHTNVGTADFFTSDGLYIGRLFRDTRAVSDSWPVPPRRGQSLSNVTPGGEWFGGQFFQRPDDGRMFVVCGRRAGVVAEVKGLETATRLPEQSIPFNAEQYAAAQKLLAAAKAEDEEQKSIQIARLDIKPDTAPGVDSFTWNDKFSASWRYDQTRGAKASWGYDDENLFVAFQVADDTPMVNSGEDVRQLFKFGDAAILELRTDPAQESIQPAKGDLRLLFSVHQGRPVAVLYDYVRPDSEKRIELTSVKTTVIDRFEVLTNARVEIVREAGRYILTAAIPLADLGWKPEPGKTVSGDFGIVYSDQTGLTNMLRMYWSNKATGMVSDLSLEADIQPVHWGRFVIQETE